MKYLLFIFVVGLVGCQSRPAALVLPTPTASAVPVKPVPVASAPPVPPPVPAAEVRIRQLTQYVEALISQIDALKARMSTVPGDVPAASAIAASTEVAASLPPTLAPIAPPLPTPSEPTLSPNAHGVIDLVAATLAENPGEPVNPFTVRTVAPEAMREVSLQVGGIVAGPSACAVINDHLVQAGETIESFAVERIEADAVLLRHSGRLLRLPVAEKSTRVRLPL